MKKMIVGVTMLIVVLAVTSCGSSRKYGCPSVAKISHTQFIKA